MRHYALSVSFLFVLSVFNFTGCVPANTPPQISELTADGVAEKTKPAIKASIYRDIQFVSYLQSITGLSSVNGWSGKDPTSHVWAVLLGYSGNDYSVEVLTRVYQVYDPETHRPEIQSTASSDSDGSIMPHTWKILQPTFGTVPMRIFSGLAKVTNKNAETMIVQYELVYTWENGSWRQLGHSKRELELLPRVQKYPTVSESTAEDGP